MFSKRLIVVFFATVVPIFAEGPDAPANPPGILLRIVQAVEGSKIDEVTSRTSDSNSTYHLREAHFLGSVTRDKHTYNFGWLRFIRSHPVDRETPPARGHDFIVVLNPDLKLVSYARVDTGPYRIEGNRLIGEEGEVDLQSKEPLTRYKGFFVGGQFLPYPFPDRITEEEWRSGNFKR